MFSFIIPTYNEEKVIVATLQKLRQGFGGTPFEIIVSDNHSQDATVELAGPYADKVVVCPDPSRTTIGATRNRGAKVARFPLLVFVDSGVFIPDHGSFFAKVLKAFQQDPELVGFTVNIRVYPEIATFADNFFFGLLDAWFRVSNNILHIGQASGKFLIVKATAFWQAGGFNPKLVGGEDIKFFQHLSRIGGTKFDSSLTVFHGGRRAHAIGWPRLLWQWAANSFEAFILKRSIRKEWKDIR